jgi:hypothetical protein
MENSDMVKSAILADIRKESHFFFWDSFIRLPGVYHNENLFRHDDSKMM